MNGWIYLVQVVPDLRFAYEAHTERIIYLGAGATAFPSRLQAEEWASHHPPTLFNPFVGLYEQGYEFPFYIRNDASPLDESREITQEEMRKFVKELGLVPPPATNAPGSAFFDRPWRTWWDQTASDMTDEQKSALWKFLVSNPYRIVPVELEP